MFKNYFFFALLFTFFGNIYAQDAFITKWKIESNQLELSIPVYTYTYNFDIDWGDGATQTGITDDVSHTYAQAGEYTVKITGNFPYIYFDDKTQLIDVTQWGTIKWESMNASFNGCSNLPLFSATDSPDLSNVTDMSGMFFLATSFNGDLSNWNVSSVTEMFNMFVYAASFNGDLSKWDVSSVTDMNGMFAVTDSFNGDISNWDVSSVNDMSFMFNEALSFNGDLSNWDVSNVTEMIQMFNLATSFNGDLSNWDVSNVTEMAAMFIQATSFNGDLSNWDVSKVIHMSDMFWGVTLSTNNYDALLKGWSDLTLQNGIGFSGGNSKYCNSATERQKIIDNFGWTITDGGLESGCSGLGVDDEILSQDFKLYPNPVSDILTIESKLTIEKVEIFNILGQKEIDINSDFNAIHTGNLSRGIYFIRVYSDKGTTVRKLIKK